MKKTLVALAALAATGAFAQVTITGKLGVSLQKTAAVATTAASQGLQVSDGDVVFAATEDLGGGYAASASSAVKLRGRDSTVTARDASVTLKTPVAAISMGAMESGSLLTTAWAGAPISSATGPDGLVIDGYNNIDYASVAVPMGAATVAATFFELGATDDGLPAPSAAFSTTAAYSASTGTGGNRSGVSGYQLTAGYSAGALSVTGDYTMFMAAKGVNELFDGHNRFRIAGTYDLGVAKVGLGFQSKNKSVASQYSAGVNVPVGAVEFGLVYNARNAQEAVRNEANTANLVSAADARSSTSVGLRYNLSKTANVLVAYTTYSGVGSVSATNTAATSDNEYRIRLLKSF